MTIKKTNKFVEFFKRFGVYVGVGVVVVGVSLTFAITAIVNAGKGTVPVINDKPLQFVLPMSNPTVIKDFSDTALQKNETLNQWEAHLALDLTSEDNLVFAVLDGTVSDVFSEHLEGKTIKITHANGYVSYYGSLADEVMVKVGDTVKAGDKLGTASKSAAAEAGMGEHLHFHMTYNDADVDPNNYLDIQNK